MSGRIFNGKKYSWWALASTKQEAERKAKGFRKEGYLVRIIQPEDSRQYHIYTRPRKGK